MSALDKIIAMYPNRIKDDIDLKPYMDDTYKPRVKSAIEYADELSKRIRQKGSWGDKTGFQCDEHFRFRPREITIWTGYKGHGKSALLSQALLGLIQQGRKVFVCSPEFHPVELLYRFLVQFLACDNPSEEEARGMLEMMAESLWLYDIQSSLKPQDVPALCRWVVEHIKPNHIVIDSLMKCGINPDDYNAQKKLVDAVQTVAHQNEVHIHIVAHARKGSSDDKPAKLHDIKGASEIADLAENVVSVWRNKPKEQAISMGAQDQGEAPDALFVVEAQRNCGGWVGTTQLFYERSAMIYFEPGRSFKSYVSIPNEVEL